MRLWLSLPFPAHIQGKLSLYGAPQGPGLLTQLCSQNGQVVPDTSLTVQAHCCMDSAVFGLNGEATLWIRVGEDGVSREDGLIWEWSLSCLPYSPLCSSCWASRLILLECPNVLSRAVPAVRAGVPGKPCDVGGPDSTGVVEGETLPVFQTCSLCSRNLGTCVSSLLCLRPPM